MQVGPRAWGGSGQDAERAMPPEFASITDLGPVRRVFEGEKNVLTVPIILSSIGLALAVAWIGVTVFVDWSSAIALPLPAVILLLAGLINLNTLVGAARVVVTYQDGLAATARSSETIAPLRRR